MLKDWDVATPEVELLGLLHDASEAYLLDIPRPWKGKVYIGNKSYVEVEDSIQDMLFEWVGISQAYADHWDIVKEADMEVYREEADARPSPSIMLMSPLDVRKEFLWRWDCLAQEISA